MQKISHHAEQFKSNLPSPENNTASTAFPLEHTASFRPSTPVGWASAPVSPHFEAVDESGLSPARGPGANPINLGT